MPELPIDHVAIAVESIDALLPALELLTGSTASARERVESQNVDVVFIGHGAARIELIQPTAADSTVGRFLQRRGPGLHHIAYRTGDIDAELERLRAAGVQLIDQVARPGAGGHRVAFLHPKSTGGVLVELVEG